MFFAQISVVVSFESLGTLVKAVFLSQQTLSALDDIRSTSFSFHHMRYQSVSNREDRGDDSGLAIMGAQ